jgi:hypothetical protein
MEQFIGAGTLGQDGENSFVWLKRNGLDEFWVYNVLDRYVGTFNCYEHAVEFSGG